MLNINNISSIIARAACNNKKAFQNAKYTATKIQFKEFTSSQQKNDNDSLLFDKILIANRGEIACRVIKTAKRLGIQTVALYSEVDGPQSLHASMADEAYLIGTGPSPSESYLLADHVLDIAKTSGAQAIHPGYGFLSENSNFAKAAQDNSITFIGPPPSAILAMGSKSHSKSIMDEASVPTTPGYHGSNQDPEYLLHEAVTNIGFPLLIKASMGGGGKGMRIVTKSSEFLSALESCKRESKGSFGDTNVILEKFLVSPRHIEIQIMADTFGNTVYLHERDCSLQRRHQKIIEEAPASDLNTFLRQSMGEAACKAAKAVGYVNAGTVEFLLDTQSKHAEQQPFYFCEMNTRLQVEHPVTEAITGLDLVEWQLRIAAGQVLPILDQQKIPCRGHSFEARIYAENPAKNFLPATGKLWHLSPPCQPNVGNPDDEVRVDTAVQQGDTISVYYDPMISKLIVHGKSREEARKRLIASLKKYKIAGVPSNIPFLINCASHPTFQTAGAINTGFLEDFADDVHVLNNMKPLTTLEQAMCSLALSLIVEQRQNIDNYLGWKLTAPWSNFSGSWRLGGSEGRYKRILSTVGDGDATSDIKCISNRDGSYEIIVKTQNDEESITANGKIMDGSMDVIINCVKKASFSVAYQEDESLGTINVKLWSNSAEDLGISYAFGMTFQNPLLSSHVSTRTKKGNLEAGNRSVTAPMPGKVTRIEVKNGDSVEENDVLLVMEAMKMEHTIKAPVKGIVEDVSCTVGNIVNDGHVLLTVKN